MEIRIPALPRQMIALPVQHVAQQPGGLVVEGTAGRS
jgi:hypothetical protein